jgi:hypothetical protein
MANCLDSICSHLCFLDYKGFADTTIKGKEPTYNESA